MNFFSGEKLMEKELEGVGAVFGQADGITM